MNDKDRRATITVTRNPDAGDQLVSISLTRMRLVLSIAAIALSVAAGTWGAVSSLVRYKAKEAMSPIIAKSVRTEVSRQIEKRDRLIAEQLQALRIEVSRVGTVSARNQELLNTLVAEALQMHMGTQRKETPR